MSEMPFTALNGLRVALINMPIRESAVPNTPPQGPGLLASRLRQYGASVSLIDLNGYRIKDEIANQRELPNGRHLSEAEVTGLITRYFNRDGEPHLIGLSGMITTLSWQTKVAKILSQLVPEACLISGGGLASELKRVIFNWIPELHGIVIGEGDNAIIEIAHKVKAGLNSKSRYLWSRPKVFAGTRPNLDQLPFPAWDLLEEDVDGFPLLEEYIKTPVWGGTITGNSSATPFSMRRSLTTVSSRGCPLNCSFCYRGTQGERRYGCRSADNLIAEAIWLRDRYRLDFLGFPDDNFSVNLNRLETLATDFKNQVGLKWGTHARLDVPLDRLELMARAGCVYIGFGAESASPKILKRMNKGGEMLAGGLVKIGDFSFPQTMVRGVINSRDTSIHANCTWIMGYPGETLDDLKVSVAFILWQIKEAVGDLIPGSKEFFTASGSINQKMFMATAYPGTAMFREPKVKEALMVHFGLKFKAGRLIPDENFKRYIEALDDASKVLTGLDGQPINYSQMTNAELIKARQLIDAGQLADVLNL